MSYRWVLPQNIDKVFKDGCFWSKPNGFNNHILKIESYTKICLELTKLSTDISVKKNEIDTLIV